MKIDEIDENLDEKFHLFSLEDRIFHLPFSSIFISLIGQTGKPGQQQRKSEGWI
jgi:hypothetical protein